MIKNIAKPAKPLKFILIMTVSERLRSCWGPSRLAQHRDLRSSPWRKHQKLHRPPFEWTTELALISFPTRWVESHISPSKRVLWRCHSKQSSCSCEFGCRSFIEHTLWAICFQIFIWKNWRVLTSQNSTRFHWTFHFRILWKWEF